MKKYGVLTIRIFALCLLTVALWQCEAEPPQKEEDTALPMPPNRTPIANQRKIPKFEQDSAYAFIAKQVSFGTRVPNSPGHTACKNWLVSKLKSYKAEVIEQDFTAKAYYGETYNGTNIIAQYNTSAKERLMLAAHWDTRHIGDQDDDVSMQTKPIDGADDGGSGVGVLLEIARLIAQNGIDIGIDIILFDAEDNGSSSDAEMTREEQLASHETWCLGSQHWAKNPHKANYTAMYGILLDMVGAKGAVFPYEGYSVSTPAGGAVVNKIWGLAEALKFDNYFQRRQAGAITDDHVFVMKHRKFAVADIINLSKSSKSSTFGAHWHTHDDNLDIIDKDVLKAVGRVVTAAIYRENNGTLNY
jgi:Zn-dependent M28 family amino/carboxypeptidase